MKKVVCAAMIHRWFIWLPWKADALAIIDRRGKWAGWQRKAMRERSLRMAYSEACRNKGPNAKCPQTVSSKSEAVPKVSQEKWRACGKENDQVCRRKMRLSSHGSDLRTPLSIHLVTLLLMSIAQSLCSLEQRDGFTDTIALTEGVISVDPLHHFPKTTVQYNAEIWSFPEDPVFQQDGIPGTVVS